ncbi:lysophospholipid acyltransferase family protein [Acidipropionibacterium virtanenii]|uniref:Phospholipid/glycerol acyltransferase domain-containing protein n=1 Tax=Acidipropionibacterium virtanenii TaxID=2057246 RepID=A0A344UVD1_9ACTN|nr:lysophospholipid acyltransferase family protein [Acidipropionibacterium virtanenii]AXE39229.1 hypothetical protein JS278_02077 [Acidipropionibacterium virtanenii]
MSRLPRWTGGRVDLTGAPPPDGAVVVAVHHTRHDDAVVVRAALHPIRSPWLGLVTPTRAVPWGTSARSRALAALRAGRLVVVFPEGGTAPGEAVYKGDVEVAHLALEAGAPVVPAVLSADRTRLELGAPLDFSRHATTPHSRAVLRAVTDEVMEALSRLCGLPYHDLPAAAARQEESESRRERARAARAGRVAARRKAALQRQEAKAEAAEEAADLAEAAIAAREAARLQAREAALSDRLRAAGIRPGEPGRGASADGAAGADGTDENRTDEDGTDEDRG